jgi:hypothetical protein
VLRRRIALRSRPVTAASRENDQPAAGNRLNVTSVADRTADVTLCRSDRLNVSRGAPRCAAFTFGR